MTRLLLCFFMFLFPLGAQANPELARYWGLEANRLSTQTSDLMHSIDTGQALEISDTYVIDIHRFGRTSTQLALWNDRANGPNALGCFFRGLAMDAENSLSGLEARADLRQRRESLLQLSAMFSDAQVIAIAAQRRKPASGRVVSLLGANCVSRIETSFQSLH